MKTSRSLVIATLILLMSASVMAEEWHFGPTLGYENTNFKMKTNNEEAGLNNLSGFNIGFLAACDPIEYFSIQTGVCFVMNGYQLKGSTFLDKYKQYLNIEEKTNLFYLNFPVYLIGKIPVGSAYLNIECGPNLYAGLDSHSKITLNAGSETYSESENLFDDGIDRFNCTIHLAGGFEYSGFRIMAGYNFGVYNMWQNNKNRTSDESLKMSGFVINLSYLF